MTGHVKGSLAASNLTHICPHKTFVGSTVHGVGEVGMYTCTLGALKKQRRLSAATTYIVHAHVYDKQTSSIQYDT